MLKVFSPSYYDLPMMVPKQYTPVDNYLVTNYNNCPPVIKSFIDSYYKKHLTKSDTNSAQYIICNIITQKFVEKHPDAIAVAGYYNEPGEILFARHAWISYNGIEYDLRAITERKYFNKSPQYTKVIKVKETPGSNLTEQKDIYDDKAYPIDNSKIKYFSKCPDSGCVQKKPNGKWGVISGKTGKFWEADYETEEDARAGLRGYFAHKHFSNMGLKIFSNRKRGEFKLFSDSKITSNDEFREYAHNVMKQAHGDTYSKEMTDKVVDELLQNNQDADYGELVGRLTSGFGK